MTTQILVHSAETLQNVFYQSGSPVDPDSQTATVTITGDDGTAIATAAAATRTDQGVYTYQLGPQTELNLLRVQWTGVFSGVTQTTAASDIEIVGGYYVSLAEIRAMRNLDNVSKFTTAELIEARQWFERLAERYCGQAFVPRYKRKRFSGNGSPTLLLDPNVRTIRSVRDYTTGTAYTSYTSDQLADLEIDPVGGITRLSTGVWRYGGRNIEVVYEHGMDSCPDDLRLAAKNAIRHRLLDDETGHRPYAEQTDVGFLRFSRPGPNRPVGDDDIDSVLNGYRMVPVG